MVRSYKFQELSQDELRCGSAPTDNGSTEDCLPVDKKEKVPYILVTVTISILILTISFSFYIGRIWDSQFSRSSKLRLEDITQYCKRRLVMIYYNTENRIAPLLDDMPLTYTLKRFNGSLLKPNVFRGDAGLEVDEVWGQLGVNYRSIAIPSTMAAKSGLKADQVKINSKYGGGYPANIEGLHHLHCLNLLRQSLYYNFEYYNKKGEGAFKNEPHILKLHVSHCLDILRQQLMCIVDIGVLGQVWIHPAAPEPYVDFNTYHKCRNFEEIRQWAKMRQMPPADEVPNDWLEPPKVGDTIYDEMP